VRASSGVSALTTERPPKRGPLSDAAVRATCRPGAKLRGHRVAVDEPSPDKVLPKIPEMTITPLVEKVPRAAAAPGPRSRLCARSYEVARGGGGGSANAARAAASAEPNVALVQRKI
jgi:hypothetical protein